MGVCAHSKEATQSTFLKHLSQQFHKDILESKTRKLHFCFTFQVVCDLIHNSTCMAWGKHVTLLHSPPVDLQIIMLVPLWVQRIPHSICWVALSWAVHHHFGKRIWQPCKSREWKFTNTLFMKEICVWRCDMFLCLWHYKFRSLMCDFMVTLCTTVANKSL